MVNDRETAEAETAIATGGKHIGSPVVKRMPPGVRFELLDHRDVLFLSDEIAVNLAAQDGEEDGEVLVLQPGSIEVVFGTVEP